MKTLSLKILTILTGLFLAATKLQAQYTVSNDLTSAFVLTYWTNSTGTNLVLQTTNLLVGSNVVLTVSTNGNAGIGIQATNAAATLFIPWANTPASPAVVGDVLATGLQLVASGTESVPQIQTVLKSYFVTGYKPKQNNYWELIDTMFWYINQTYIYSQQAQQAASAMTNLVSQFYVARGVVNLVSPSAPVIETGAQNINLATVSRVISQTWGSGYQVNFSNALTSTNYQVLLAPKETSLLAGWSATGHPVVYNQTTNSFFVMVPPFSSFGAFTEIGILIPQ
ncbi:MAG TPA: hypothetical protein VGO57_14275 [Verrucomicrobiae bacterium]|jgi:hypothetical protein